MKLSNKVNVLIIGLGLMGGAYAIGLKRKGYRVTAITRSEASIKYALENGIIDEGSTTLDPKLLGEAELVVFGLYPNVFIDWIRDNQHLLRSGAVITDVTGVKTSVVYEIQEMLRPDIEFVPAHPMAGREVYGVQNSAGVNVSEANFIVTPTDRNTSENVEAIKKLGEEIGFAKISVLSPEDHDEMIAFVSQLAHCLAVVLMTCNELENIEDYTGNSFRDLTRIAHINENMWSELFMMNKDALLKQMDLFSAQFNSLRNMIERSDVDAMKKMMIESTVRRDKFDKKG
jgi:prephenate dehydrogenase